jgi:predicted Fe-Mo cluster-binding NifX family protein
VKRVRLFVTAFVLVFVPLLLFAEESLRTGNIAVASNERAPMASVADRMGRGRFYLVYDNKGVFIKAIENPSFGKRERPAGTSMIDSVSFDEKGVMTGGIATPSREERQQAWDGFSDFFTRAGIRVVIAEEFGDEIVRGMRDRGIECVAFRGSAEQAVQSAIQRMPARDNGKTCDEKDEACTVPNKAPILQKRMSSIEGEKE